MAELFPVKDAVADVLLQERGGRPKEVFAGSLGDSLWGPEITAWGLRLWLRPPATQIQPLTSSTTPKYVLKLLRTFLRHD